MKVCVGRQVALEQRLSIKATQSHVPEEEIVLDGEERGGEGRGGEERGGRRGDGRGGEGGEGGEGRGGEGG